MSAFMDIPEVRSFILHWGEMGTQWGVNRSVAQMHALLYLSDRPLPAEEICTRLGLDPFLKTKTKQLRKVN